MGLTKRMYDEMVLEPSEDFDYQYEQWLQQQAEISAYEEMLADVASFMVIK